MKSPGLLISVLILLGMLSCQPSEKQADAGDDHALLTPEELYGELLHDVQMAKIFPDGKTFVDCTPKKDPAIILESYKKTKTQPGFDLKLFVAENFDLPIQHSTGFVSDRNQSPQDHITSLWPVLTRQPDQQTKGTLIPLPKPYIVPGGRFGEIYYWDSYFTMLGLQVDGRADMVENMADNFAYLIDKVGFIPNGNRTYYLGRSQPPFFSMIVGVLAEMKGDSAYQQYLPQLEKEHAFWMDGADKLTEQQPTHRRVVRLQGGEVLNRYWDDRAAPRPESYREDVETASASGRPLEEVYRHLRAGAESGWDFSSRWLADGKTLATIRTTDIVPVDLNCLLYHLEWVIAQAYLSKGDQPSADKWIGLAKNRVIAVQKYLWQQDAGFFMDYDFVNKKITGIRSLAGVFPLFFKLATPEQAGLVAKAIEKDFLRPGGVVTTLNNTGQQWDAPNGWAPLQWLTIKGLNDFGHDKLAATIAQRWVELNKKVYRNTGKMLEKYNVEDVSLEAGGGEYPVQDGFGWTNGVLMRLLKERNRGG